MSSKQPGVNEPSVFEPLNFYVNHIFASLLKRDLLSKERICSCCSNIFSFKSKPQSERAMSAREVNRDSQKLLPLVKIAIRGDGKSP